MQRNTSNNATDPRRSAERDAAQPLGGQDRTDDDEDTLEKPEDVPSFLTARELQARDPKPSKPSANSDGLLPKGGEKDEKQ